MSRKGPDYAFARRQREQQRSHRVDQRVPDFTYANMEQMIQSQARQTEMRGRFRGLEELAADILNREFGSDYYNPHMPKNETWDGEYSFESVGFPREVKTIEYLHVIATGSPAWWCISRDGFSEHYKMVAIGEIVTSHGIGVSWDMKIHFCNCQITVGYVVGNHAWVKTYNHRS